MGLPGNANVFFKGTLMGTTYIPNTRLNEEFTIPMGVDPSVKVEYKALQIEKQESVGKEKITYSHATVVSNEKTIPVQLHITDQFPESIEENIRVKLLQPQRTRDNQMTINTEHNIEWCVTIAPSASIEIPFS